LASTATRAYRAGHVDLVFLGDVILDAPDPDHRVTGVAPATRDADLAIAHLEVPHTSRGRELAGDVPASGAEPAHLAALARAGIGAVSLAGSAYVRAADGGSSRPQADLVEADAASVALIAADITAAGGDADVVICALHKGTHRPAELAPTSARSRTRLAGTRAGDRHLHRRAGLPALSWRRRGAWYVLDPGGEDQASFGNTARSS
jgi:hypothetical protein